jgi:glycosyltransferase involved in cell wall biosynthesis
MCYENLDILRHTHFEQYGIFDHHLFASFHARKVFKNKFGDISTLIVPWAIPEEAVPAPEPFKNKRPGSLVNFVHVAGWGGINNRKNSDLLIQAFDKIQARNARLHLYTQANIDKYGPECVEILRRNRRILVHQGTIPDIFKAYRGMDMLLWPSKREGLGLPIVEALASGIPALITDGYMMKQWLIPEEHGIVCPATPKEGPMYLPEMQVDPKTLAKKIRRVVNDPSLLARLRANVLRDREIWLWSWQKQVLHKQISRIVLDPGYRPDDDCSYLPEHILEFERRRSQAFRDIEAEQ